MEEPRRWLWSPVVAAAVIGVSLIIGTVIGAGTVKYVKTFNTSLLTAVGTATQNVTSDEVQWDGSFNVNTMRAQLQSGYAQMDRDKALVSAFLTKNGIPAADVTFSPVQLQQQFADCKFTPQFCGPGGNSLDYQLTENVRVDSGNVNLVTAVAGATTPLINEGVVFSTQNVQYYYTKLPALRTKLMAAATRDAQQRAQQMVAATGGRVGRLVSLTEEPFQVTPVNSAQVSNNGQYDTTTIQKTLTAIVQATFRLP
jgi:hypothetical protein